MIFSAIPPSPSSEARPLITIGTALPSVFSIRPATLPTPPLAIDSTESRTESTKSLIRSALSTNHITAS